MTMINVPLCLENLETFFLFSNVIKILSSYTSLIYFNHVYIFDTVYLTRRRRWLDLGQ